MTKGFLKSLWFEARMLSLCQKAADGSQIRNVKILCRSSRRLARTFEYDEFDEEEQNPVSGHAVFY